MGALLILHVLACSSAACTEGEENCPANYEGEETGLAQIKVHAATSSNCPFGPIRLNWANTKGNNMKQLDAGNCGGDGTKPWCDCEKACNNEPDCVLWTYKYSPVSQNGGNNCWLKNKANAEWPGAFLPVNTDRGDSDTISGGSAIQCYEYGSLDRTDTCKDPKDNPNTATCQSWPISHPKGGQAWKQCAQDAKDQGYASYTYSYHQSTCYGKHMSLQEEYNANGGILWYNPSTISG